MTVAISMTAATAKGQLQERTDTGVVEGKTQGSVRSVPGNSLRGTAGGRFAMESASAGGSLDGREEGDGVRGAVHAVGCVRRHGVSG